MKVVKDGETRFVLLLSTVAWEVKGWEATKVDDL